MLSIVGRSPDFVICFQEEHAKDCVKIRIDADILLHRGVLIIIKTIWNFQKPNSHQLVYTFSHVRIFLTPEMHKSSVGRFFIAIFVFAVS